MDDYVSSEQESNNLDLIHAYSESVYNTVNNSINALNTKLTTVIGFSGVLIRFTNDLEITNLWLIIAKFLVCILLCVSVIFSAVGLMPGNTGEIVKPRELRENFYYEEEEKCKRYITDNLIKAIEQMNLFVKKKQRLLAISIWCLAAGTVIFALDIAIGSGLNSKSMSPIELIASFP